MLIFSKRFWAVIIIFIGVGVSVAFITSKEKAKYTIVSENGKTYYANSFRIYNKGVMFDDIYGNTVIVQGDLEIKCKKVQ